MYRFAICDDDSQFASLLKEALITNLKRLFQVLCKIKKLI